MNTTVLITGASGTVGSALSAVLQQRGYRVVAWDRHTAPPLNRGAAEHLLDSINPQFLFSLAVASRPTGMDDEGWEINANWPGQLAELCYKRNIGMLHVSSVMVFSDDTPGPITPDTEPDADTGYGYQKLCSEANVLGANPNAIIARLGWQIGLNGGNSMVTQLDKMMAEQGHIDASTAWLPATSFVEDSAAAMAGLAGLRDADSKKGPAQPAEPGIYLIDSNRHWSFAQIVRALGTYLQRDWIVRENRAFVFDQRMQDDRPATAALDARLPL